MRKFLSRHFQGLYWQQMFITTGMVLLTLALLGAAFFSLSYNYARGERNQELQEKAHVVAVYSRDFLDETQPLSSKDVLRLTGFAASVSDVNFLICATDGTVLLSTDDALDGQTAQLPESVMNTLFREGDFAKKTDLGLYERNRFVVGVPVLGRDGATALGAVFAVASTTSMDTMWQAFLGLFLMTAMVVLMIAFAVCSVTTMRQIKPIREMAQATRLYAEGDFDVRMKDYGRSDEIGELAASFNRMAETLQQTERKRRDFIANISHELKTPMTTISGYVDGILDGTIPEDKREHYLHIVSDETKRLSRLVRSMLDISQLQKEGGIPEEKKMHFDLEECAGQVLITFEKKINDKHLNVNVDMPEHPVYTMANPDYITQVIYNLIDNAVKFCPDGGNLGLRIKEGGSKAYVSVSNDGETIPPDELPLVFDRFHKLDKSRSQNRDGWGLGLYIVKTIVCSHGEDISVSSKDGKTEFTFTMPLVN